MRILASFIIGFLLFFYLGEAGSQIKKKFPFIKKLAPVTHSLSGIILILTGVIASIVFRNNPLNLLLAVLTIGAGLGFVMHHLLAKQYIISEKLEKNFVKSHESGIERFLEILPGALLWTAITSPLWLSFTLPFAVAYIILLADVYWLISALRIAILIIIGYHKMERVKTEDWLKKLQKDFPGQWDNFNHLIVLPVYKESLEVLGPAFDAVVNSKYPKKKLFLAAGFEERADPKKVHEKTIKYLEKLNKKIGGVFITIHPFGLPGEIPGPGSNRNWMINQAVKELKKRGIKNEDVLVTTLDADFVMHPQFVAGALHKYLSTPANIRDKRSYTGVFLYYNNYWQAPTPMRLIAAGTAFWQLSEMVGSDKYMNFSSLSINLKSLLAIGLWIPDKVNDDSGFYWKAYYHFQGDYKVLPHFLPISADAVLDETLAKTFKNQYQQQKRWAYGVEHIPFVVRQYFKNTELNFWDKTDKLLFALWGYVRWGMLALFVTFAGMLIPLINPNYSQSVVAYNLPIVSSWILTAAFFGMFATIYVHEKTVPPRPAHWSLLKKFWSYIQWVLIPLIMITISTVPAIDAITSLMLGKRLEFQTTNKARVAS